MSDEKYIVYSRSAFDEVVPDAIIEDLGKWVDPIPDAVVIRLQDLFAGPALYEYAGQIGTAIDLMEMFFPAAKDTPEIQNLRGVRDYFSEQAELASKLPNRKIPD